jgi:hypothetical protein
MLTASMFVLFCFAPLGRRTLWAGSELRALTARLSTLKKSGFSSRLHNFNPFFKVYS